MQDVLYFMGHGLGGFGAVLTRTTLLTSILAAKYEAICSKTGKSYS
jgi:hypothetical protein